MATYLHLDNLVLSKPQLLQRSKVVQVFDFLFESQLDPRATWLIVFIP